MKAEKVKNLGYTLGHITAVVAWACIMAIVIAVTTKIIFWII